MFDVRVAVCAQREHNITRASRHEDDDAVSVLQGSEPHRREVHGVHLQHQDVSEVRIQRKWEDHPLDRSRYDELLKNINMEQKRFIN